MNEVKVQYFPSELAWWVVVQGINSAFCHKVFGPFVTKEEAELVMQLND